MIGSSRLLWSRLLPISVSTGQFSRNYNLTAAKWTSASSRIIATPSLPHCLRFHSTDNSGSSATDPNNAAKQDGENRLKEKLSLSFPTASQIFVEDISGGCGSMYQIHVESAVFSGLNMVKQHQLVTKALQEEIKAMHGVRISTKAPSKSP